MSQAQWAANKLKILALMNDERYKFALEFYADTDPGAEGGYKEMNLLPQLDWKIKTLRIHPGGKAKNSHWRLSLTTADGKRTFFNNSTQYLSNSYGQMRIGPGRDSMDVIGLGLEIIGFNLELTSDQHHLGDFLEALLHPPENQNDGVYEDRPFCWYLYNGFPVSGQALECRHWVQAAARAFHHKGLISKDPSEIFNALNKDYGYPDGRIMKGTFFREKPKNLLQTWRTEKHQADQRDGFPDWK
ncbi:hypothetical protein F4777DRAFT_582520 [Nemania sp. FL0916]|nr:hypothetical protein F4777DRAFT_582520 [Nemania sp. FL0916]